MPPALLLRNGRPMGGASADILMRDGRIVQIAPAISAPDALVEDAGGALVLPGLVEAHTHLDKSLWGMPWRPHDAGPRLIDKIDNERALKRAIDIDPQRQSMRQVLLSVGHGSTHIRSHVDVDTDHGLWGIEGVAATRAACADLVDMDIVAFPQSGLLRRPGTLALMDAAMRAGADVVGGIDPCAIDRDPKGHLDAIFALAQKHGKPLDIHLHEPGEMGAFSFDLIFERTRALGMKGQVVVSHAFCLGTPDRELVDPMIETTGGAGHRGDDHRPGVAPGATGQAPAGRRRAGVLGLGRHPRHLGPLGQCRHAGARDVCRPAQQLPP